MTVRDSSYEEKYLTEDEISAEMFFFFFFLGPVCISSGSTAAFKAYCAYPKLLTAQIRYPCGSYEETKVP
jgi:hypothetical protein